jgi:hypothetical protein
MQIGTQLTRGLGTGGKPSLGEQAAQESVDDLGQVVAGADMLFITAGMGGGTGTGAAPVIARLAKDAGILTVVSRVTQNSVLLGWLGSWASVVLFASCCHTAAQSGLESCNSSVSHTAGCLAAAGMPERSSRMPGLPGGRHVAEYTVHCCCN